jgi:hypothetical protein
MYAVAVLRDEAESFGPPERDYLHIFETMSDVCQPVPEGLFNEPDDHRWRSQNGQMIQVA